MRGPGRLTYLEIVEPGHSNKINHFVFSKSDNYRHNNNMVIEFTTASVGSQLVTNV